MYFVSAWCVCVSCCIFVHFVLVGLCDFEYFPDFADGISQFIAHIIGQQGEHADPKFIVYSLKLACIKFM